MPVRHRRFETRGRPPLDRRPCSGHLVGPMRIGVRGDLTTGDRRRVDPRLQTFNPLFAGTAYSGRAGLVGPANSIDVTPRVQLTPAHRLTVSFDHAWYWRHSVHEGCTGSLPTSFVPPVRVVRAMLDANSQYRPTCEQTVISRSGSLSRLSWLVVSCARRSRPRMCCSQLSTRPTAFASICLAADGCVVQRGSRASYRRAPWAARMTHRHRGTLSMVTVVAASITHGQWM
jgi:Alginate export